MSSLIRAILGLLTGTAYFISFKKQEYVKSLAHRGCNDAISGHFNMTAVEDGFQCLVDGQVVHTYTLPIPSPVELTAFLAAVFLVYAILDYKMSESMEEEGFPDGEE